MDRDKYIGFTLILFLIIIYYGFFLPSQPVNEKIVSEEDEIKIIEENTPEWYRSYDLIEMLKKNILLEIE